jgi:hypothetical protein
MPSSPKDIASFNGKPVWGAVVDNNTGKPIHGVPYNEAEAADFHHSYYLPPSIAAGVNSGRYRFVWTDERGLQSMTPMDESLKAVVSEQLTPKSLPLDEASR